MMGEGAETPNPNTGRKEGICAVPSDPRGRGGGHTWLNPPPLPCCSHPSAHSSAPRTRAHTCAQLPPALFTGHGQSRTRAAARFHQALKAKIIGCRTNLGNGVCDKANKKSSILQPPPPLPPLLSAQHRGWERSGHCCTSRATSPLELHLQLGKFVREKWSFCFPCSKHVIKMLI